MSNGKDENVGGDQASLERDQGRAVTYIRIKKYEGEGMGMKAGCQENPNQKIGRLHGVVLRREGDRRALV